MSEIMVHSPSAHTQPGTADSSSLWAIGSWLSAALDDPNVCAEMKCDIGEWFDGGGYLRQAQPTSSQLPATEYGAQDPRPVVERVKGRLALSGTYVWLNRTDVEVLLVAALRSEAGERD